MTPVPMYDPTASLVDLRERYILALPGDRWKLRPIEMDEFLSIRAEVEAGTYRYGPSCRSSGRRSTSATRIAT